jgi:dTDP-4-dehydrorhamnose 3,5-epimerase
VSGVLGLAVQASDKEPVPVLFEATPLSGAYVIRPELREDARGFFARCYCAREFAAQGLHVDWVQCNISYNRQRGTLRGMHYQEAPYAEEKLVRCTAGAIYDVIIDLRRDSATYKRHFGVRLDAESRAMLYIPAGFAHGFLTLADDTEVFYQMGSFYVPEAGRCVRWDDPAFGIVWPEAVRVISDRDRDAPNFEG